MSYFHKETLLSTVQLSSGPVSMTKVNAWLFSFMGLSFSKVSNYFMNSIFMWRWNISWVHSDTSVLKVKVKSLSRLRLCDPMDYSLPGFSVHGIFQARILEWVAISFSRRSSRPRDWTCVSRIVGRCFTIWATREVPTREVTSILSCILFPACWESWFSKLEGVIEFEYYINTHLFYSTLHTLGL